MSLELDAALRERIWPARDWSTVAPELHGVLKEADLPPDRRALLLRQLGELCEFCVLDPQPAADAYSQAYRADRAQQADLLARIRHLCDALGRWDHAARTAELEFRQSRDPRFHVIAGQAWLDAGDPDRALKPLLQADRESPGNPYVEAALQVARREWSDPERCAEELLERAQNQEDARALHALQAARVWRMLDITDERYELSLRLCLEAQPNAPSACKLYERHLFETGSLDKLSLHFRTRAEHAPSAAMAVRFLLQGSSLLFRAGAGSEGGPLFVSGLQRLLSSEVRSAPGLLAQLRALVATGARERTQVVELAEVVCSRLSPDEQVGIAIFCAQISWFAQKNLPAAQRWIDRLRSLSPDSTLVAESGDWG